MSKATEYASSTNESPHWNVWQTVFGAPKYICGPMVWQSERAFRALVRSHGVGLCYTPMVNAAKFLCSCPPHVLKIAGCSNHWNDARSPATTEDTYDNYHILLQDLTTAPVAAPPELDPGANTLHNIVDRPLILQFCATTPEQFADACRVATAMFSGIPVPLCPFGTWTS
eukprot:m.1641018 g.1641018  ORF g.1641018 m.1641018 type:complete len:170 (+) comp44990_c0_seq1:228-737(+)